MSESFDARVRSRLVPRTDTVTTLEGAAEVLRAAGLEDGERLLDAIDHPDIQTGFYDHRIGMMYGPNPHQNIAANAKQIEWMDAHNEAIRMLRKRLDWDS